MRTLRPFLVGTVILALLGGLGVAVGAQDEESAPVPTWVTGESAREASEAGGMGVQVASDPRLSGRVETRNSWRSLTDRDDSAIWVSVMTIENDGGAWKGHSVGLRGPADPWVHHMQVELEGQGGYAGLRALLFYQGTQTSSTFDGHIFEGELPPLPAD